MTKNKPKDERISEIIGAAVEIFVEMGYERASMNTIAARAGVSKGGLYHHFKSKDEILLAANTEYMKPIYEFMQIAQSIADPVDSLKGFIKNYLFYWLSHEKELMFTFLSMAKMLAQNTMWPMIDGYSSEMIGFYESILRKGVETGKLRNHDVKARATALFSALDGVSGYVVMCDSLSVETITEQFIEVFLRDLQ